MTNISILGSGNMARALGSGNMARALAVTILWGNNPVRARELEAIMLVVMGLQVNPEHEHFN